jgi:tetratricopeptide (TPR) repeat protein
MALTKSVPPRQLTKRDVAPFVDDKERARRAHRRGFIHVSAKTAPGALHDRPRGAPLMPKASSSGGEGIAAKARRLIENGRHEEAQELLSDALTIQPSPELRALHAFAAAQNTTLGKQGVHELLSDINELLQDAEDNVEFRAIRAFILGRLGREDLMVREYERVLKLAPKHQAANRALRLHRMRQKEPERAPGVLAKFLTET